MPLYPVPQNRLFCTIPEHKLRQVAEHVSLFEFREGHVFHDAGQPLRQVVFPLKGVVSLIVSAEGEDGVEALMVGSEGMVGLPVFLGTDSIPWKARAHTPGEAFVMEDETFRACLAGDPCLEWAVRRYTQSVLVALAQVAFCRGAHPIEKRCARWLLTMQDRMQAPAFRLTQEFFSRTLGVRRASISQAVGKLQKLNIIRYERGQLTILDRERLEQFACGCYGLLRTESVRLFSGMATDSATPDHG